MENNKISWITYIGYQIRVGVGRGLLTGTNGALGGQGH